MTLALFAAAIALLMALLLVIYITTYRKQLEGEFSPQAAWLRAGIFFCFFYLVSYASATM